LTSYGRGPRVRLRYGLRLLGDQVRLQRDPQRLPHRLDFVRDRRHAAQVERHQAATAHPHRVAGLGCPLQSPLEQARPQVEQALVVLEPAAVNIERFVLDQQPDGLAVGDVDDHLAVLGKAVGGLAVLQRVGLVEAVEVGAREAAGLALVEVAAQPQVPVGKGEDRLRLVQQIEVQGSLVYPPRLHREQLVGDHRGAIRSVTSPIDASAPCSTSSTAVRNASGIGLPGLDASSRIQLHDRLSIDGSLDLADLRLPQDAPAELVMVGLQPSRDRGDEGGRIAHGSFDGRAVSERDRLAGGDLIARNVDPPPVDGDVPVDDELPGLGARGGQTEAHEHVVKPQLEQPEKVVAGAARPT
jgi:hypothetical protein